MSAKRDSDGEADSPITAEVVCFGMITPAIVLTVDRLPEQNTGALYKKACEFISDDAAIVANLLRGWGIRSGLIGTALGNDPPGRKVVRWLKARGILGKPRLLRRLTTPLEVNISDSSGGRTYFWRRDPEVLDTLDTADLALLEETRLLYVDWYDGDHILRPMQRAAQRNILIFLNLEHGHQNSHALSRYVPRTTICQAVTDSPQHGGDPMEVAEKLLEAGATTALVTLAADGCLALRGRDAIRALAPSVPVVDGCGAGATFSAGFIYGWLRGWDLEDTIRFATAAASLKCTVVGPQAIPISAINELAAKVEVIHSSSP